MQPQTLDYANSATRVQGPDDEWPVRVIVICAVSVALVVGYFAISLYVEFGG